MCTEQDRMAVLAGLSDLFPNRGEAEGLFGLCLNCAGYPYGLDHVDLLAELAGVALIPRQRDLAIQSYVYLAGYYFALDSVVDKHQRAEGDAPKLTQLFFAFHHHLRLLFPATEAYVSTVAPLVASYLSQNTAAAILELDLLANPTQEREEDDRQSAVGRGNSFILFYELLALIGGQSANKQIVGCLADLIYMIQLSDDLVDWEKDFQSGHYTSLTRYCFSLQNRLMTFSETAREIYVRGVYERRIATVIKGLRSILQKTSSISGASSTRLSSYIERHAANLSHSLQASLMAKAAARSRYV